MEKKRKFCSDNLVIKVQDARLFCACFSACSSKRCLFKSLLMLALLDPYC